uniref:DUF834 domain-containing protein n=1 Tax=Oryza sativa subsp. indica TaxID=39946 RepID=C5NNV7_ORYSI|nr:hypothetical protein [Oryza sativa Indica Group]
MDGRTATDDGGATRCRTWEAAELEKGRRREHSPCAKVARATGGGGGPTVYREREAEDGDLGSAVDGLGKREEARAWPAEEEKERWDSPAGENKFWQGSGDEKRRPRCFSALRSEWRRRRGAAMSEATAAHDWRRFKVVAVRMHGGRGVSAEVCGNGAVAGVRRGMGKPAVQAARRGGGYGDGGVQPELAGGRRRAERRGESEGECGGFGRNGETREDAPGIVYIHSWRENHGQVGRQRPAKWQGLVGSWAAKPAPVFGEKWGRRWRRGVASCPTRERARGGREWRRRGQFSAAMAATAVAGLRLGKTGGAHGSHLSAKEEREAG